MTDDRKAYPSDVSDDEWSLVVPYLMLMTEAAPQRDYRFCQGSRHLSGQWGLV